MEENATDSSNCGTQTVQGPQGPVRETAYDPVRSIVAAQTQDGPHGDTSPTVGFTGDNGPAAQSLGQESSLRDGSTPRRPTSAAACSMTSNGSTCDSGEFDTEEEPFDQVEGELSTVRGPNGELRLVRSIQTQTNEDDFDCASPARASRGKRKIDGALSPSRKRRRAKGPTRLRKGKPVASRVPMDVWEMVLSHCPGKFLARARRIDRSFYQMLTYESAWRKNRLQNNGSDMPGPFPGMKEDHYANLLEGLGCMDCLTPKTRKTFWVWRQRWCFDCFGKNTIRVRGPSTMTCRLPTATAAANLGGSAWLFLTALRGWADSGFLAIGGPGHEDRPGPSDTRHRMRCLRRGRLVGSLRQGRRPRPAI